MSKAITKQDQNILFNEARTYNAWQSRPVEEDVVRQVYNLLKMAPTSANCSPARFKFLTSDEAKQRLKPHLDAGNVDKTMAAPVVVIIANDLEFYEHMPKLFPHTDAKSWFVGNDAKIQDTAMRNGTLQGGYLIMAARAMGLDCGPMSGFDAGAVKKEFFSDDNVEVNFLCNIGYGSPENLYPRSPRFDFDDVCEFL